MDAIQGAHCLDLFAGSGALAFEALSRGAASVTALELNAELMQMLRENQARLQAEALQLIQADALDWLASCENRYDLIFLDPPFAADLLNPALEIIRQGSLLKPEGLLYIECPVDAQLAADLIKQKQKSTAQVQYGLYRL